jgi:hypothetical protein
MGYYTYYTLEATAENTNDLLDFQQWLTEIPTTNEPIHSDIWNIVRDVYYKRADTTKWYENKEDMKTISAQFPRVLFTLKGEGEEAGDIWYKYFKNGKMQVCKAVITFPPFNENELK